MTSARVALAALALLAGCSASGGGATSAKAYAKPAELVSLPDGRKLNLHCSGSGSPTVLLESGFGAGASAWYKVQPTLARTTRVCAYDRAGYGFSDPGPLPRDGAATARDLDQALTAAKMAGPFIVVGHSAGGLYARLFAARRPSDVAGLILLDPTVERRAPQPVGDGLDGIRRRIQRCLAASLASPQPADGDPQWAGCLPGKPDANAIQIALRPDTWRNQLSELDSIYGRTSDQIFRLSGLLHDIPMYVITASDTAAAAPSYGFDKPESALVVAHRMMAGMSSVGSQQTVLSSHMVMLNRPEVVIATAEEMVRANRAGRPPEPLGPSETEPLSGDDAFTTPGAAQDALTLPRPPGAF